MIKRFFPIPTSIAEETVMFPNKPQRSVHAPDCAGLAFGSYWTLAPVLTSEWFGLRAFASNLSLLSVHTSTGISCMLVSPACSQRAAVSRR